MAMAASIPIDGVVITSPRIIRIQEAGWGVLGVLTAEVGLCATRRAPCDVLHVFCECVF